MHLCVSSVGAVGAPVIREKTDFGLSSRNDALQAGLLWWVTHVIQHPSQQLWDRRGCNRKKQKNNSSIFPTRKIQDPYMCTHTAIKLKNTFSSVPPKSALYHLNIWLRCTSFFTESTTQASSFSRKASAAVRSWLSMSWEGRAHKN